MASHRISSFIVRFPLLVISVITAVTLVLLYHASAGLSLRVVLEEMLPVERHNVKLIQKFGPQFGGANTTLISLESAGESIYQLPFLEAYQKVSDDIYFHPDALRHLVQSLALRKTKAVSGSGGRIQIDALMWPRLPESESDMEALKRNIKTQYKGLLVSDDERSAMIIADFKDGTDYESLVAFIDTLRADVAAEGITLYASGRPILLGNIYQALDKTLLILGSSLLLVALILFLYFRNILGVVVPLLSAATASIWGLGVMGYVSYNLDPLLILLPAFIFAIVLSHSVQFISRVFEEFEEHHHMKEAVRHGLAKLLFPSVAAVVTDAAGFTVLVLVGIPSIQALALICTIWLLAITPSLFFSAALLCQLPRPKSYRIGIHLIDKLWTGLNLAQHSKLVIVLSLTALLLGVMGATKLTIGDSSGSPILWPDSRYNQDAKVINQEFSAVGTDLMQVYIEGDANAMLDPKVYHQIEALDRHVYQSTAEARPAQSLVPIIKNINAVLYEGDPSYAIIPDTKEEIGFNIYLFQSKGEPGDFAAYTNSEWQIGNISIPLKDHAAETVNRATENISQFVSNAAPLENNTEFLFSGGQIGITKAVNDEIAESNNLVLLTIVTVIALCVLVLYRSLTVCLILVVSLGIANFLTYAFMAGKGIGLSINTLPLTALGIGLGVDYAIYMLDRIREESRRGAEYFEAVRSAIMTSGNAIFLTAMTMILPLIPWFLFSTLRFQAEMGLLLGMVLFFNMVGSMLFVPATILYFKPRAILGTPQTTSG